MIFSVWSFDAVPGVYVAEILFSHTTYEEIVPSVPVAGVIVVLVPRIPSNPRTSVKGTPPI